MKCLNYFPRASKLLMLTIIASTILSISSLSASDCASVIQDYLKWVKTTPVTSGQINTVFFKFAGNKIKYSNTGVESSADYGLVTFLEGTLSINPNLAAENMLYGVDRFFFSDRKDYNIYGIPPQPFYYWLGVDAGLSLNNDGSGSLKFIYRDISRPDKIIPIRFISCSPVSGTSTAFISGSMVEDDGISTVTISLHKGKANR